MNTLIMRFQASWHSYRSLPAWVQVWVGAILIPANAASFFMLDFWAGRMAAWAALVVVATNLPIMLRERGMSRLMSMPHLLAWGPLEYMLILRIGGHVGPLLLSAAERNFAIAIAIINGVSLLFDSRDSWLWLRGDRALSVR